MASSRMRSSTVGSVDAAAVLVEVLEALAPPPAADAGTRAVDSSQPCHGGWCPQCRRVNPRRAAATPNSARGAGPAVSDLDGSVRYRTSGPGRALAARPTPYSKPSQRSSIGVPRRHRASASAGRARPRPAAPPPRPPRATISCAAATSTERTSRSVIIASSRPAATRHIAAATEPSTRRRRASKPAIASAAAATQLRAAPSPGRAPRAGRARGARSRSPSRKAPSPRTAHQSRARVELGHEAHLHVAHPIAGGHRDRHARERQAALGVHRAIDRVDHHAARAAPPPTGDLAALLGDRRQRHRRAPRARRTRRPRPPGRRPAWYRRPRRGPLRHRALGGVRVARHGLARSVRRTRGRSASQSCSGRRHPRRILDPDARPPRRPEREPARGRHASRRPAAGGRRRRHRQDARAHAALRLARRAGRARRVRSSRSPSPSPAAAEMRERLEDAARGALRGAERRSPSTPSA